MITGLRPVDALVAWVLNAAAPLLGGLLWVMAAREFPGSGGNLILRVLGAGLIVLWLVWRRGLRVGNLIDSFRSSRRGIWIGATVGLALFAIEYLAVVIWHFIDRTPNLVDGTWNPWVASPSLAGPYPVYFLGLVVVGPLIEELVHRGVAYNALLARLGRKPSMLATTVVFALGHPIGLYGTQILSALLTGLVLVWLADRYRSLGPPLAAHVVINLAVFLIGWAAYNLFGIPGHGLD